MVAQCKLVARLAVRTRRERSAVVGGENCPSYMEVPDGDFAG